MNRMILNYQETEDFFGENSKGFRMIEIEEAEIDLDSQFGVKFTKTGRYNIIFDFELSEYILKISNSHTLKHKVSLRYIKQESDSNTEYLNFSGLGIGDVSYNIEILFEKESMSHCILCVFKQFKFDIKLLYKIDMLDLNDFLERNGISSESTMRM